MDYRPSKPSVLPLGNFMEHNSNFELWCNAGDLALNYGNITNIVGSEVDSEKYKNRKRILKSFGINFLTKL